MISREAVEHVARLARLQLGEPELERMREQLSGILELRRQARHARHHVGGAHLARRAPRERRAGGRGRAVLAAGGDAGQRSRSRRRVLPGPAHHRGLTVPFRSVHELSAAYRAGEITPSAVTEAHLARVDGLDGRVGAYLTVMREEALAVAREARRPLSPGPAPGPAGRGADRPQGQPLRARDAGHGGLADPRALRPAVRRDRGGAAAGRPGPCFSARPTWTSSPWARPPSTPPIS